MYKFISIITLFLKYIFFWSSTIVNILSISVAYTFYEHTFFFFSKSVINHHLALFMVLLPQLRTYLIHQENVLGCQLANYYTAS